MKSVITRPFYERDTVQVARDLLGTVLVHELSPGDVRRGRIVETEAYVGSMDLACHAARGRTARTEVMFGEAGHAYVYMIYGMYYCLNVVTEQLDFPAAVLIRGVEPLSEVSGRTDGPGRLCRAFQIDRSLTGHDLTQMPLYLERGAPKAPFAISEGPRVGVDYAGEWAERPWRFWIEGNPYVSRGGPARGARQKVGNSGA